MVLKGVVCLLAVSLAPGQEVTPRDGSCDQTPDVYDGKFKIRAVRVEHPFAFVRFIGKNLGALQRQGLPTAGSVLDLEKVKEGKEAIERWQFLPSPVGAPVRLDVVLSSLANCRNSELDVVYRIFSTQILPTFSSVFESREIELREPQRSAGLNTQPAFRLVPAFHYDASKRFQGGGRLDWRTRRGGLSTGSLEGRGSSTSWLIAGTLAGDHAWRDRGIALAEWQVAYLNSMSPAETGSLSEGRLAARVSFGTRPLGKTPFILRFGASLEGGNQQSGFSGTDVAPNTLANTGFGSLKWYLGVSARQRRQALTASYGLDLGTLGASTDIQYRRHIGDLGYSFSVPAGDHREIELESRFTAGAIQTPGKIPLPQRFFGGNLEQAFIAGDSWRIRSNPVLRSFPANRFSRAGQGVGAEEFFAYNLTGAVAVWRRPLVPREITAEQDFKDALDMELSVIPGLLAADRISKDQEFKQATQGLPGLWDRLVGFEGAVNSVQVPGNLQAQHKMCRGRMAVAKVALRDFKTKKSAELLSLVNSMVDPGREMAKALKACLQDLNGPLGNAEIAARGGELRQQVEKVKGHFDTVDFKKYEAQAENETKPIRRVIDSILYDLNIYSVSPVFAFDVARIGECQPGTSGGVRYGVGGGLRLTLVKSVSFTLGYMVNRDRRPSEGRGALFFGLALRDLFE